MLGVAPDFEHWLLEHGLHVRGIGAAHLSDGQRGIIALRAITAGSVLLEVPGKLLMSANKSRHSPHLVPVLAACPGLSPTQVLALHLLVELARGRASFWAAYLAQLPRAFTCLSYFSAHEAAALQVGHAVDVAREAAASVRAEWQGAASALVLLESADLLPRRLCGLLAWRWAAATLASRAMHLPGDAAGALAPFADLHNHRPSPGPDPPPVGALVPGEEADAMDPRRQEVRDPACGSGDGCYHEAADVYRLTTHVRYAEGEQVFLCYGRHTNLDLLEHYGFLLEGNGHDRALLPPGAFGALEPGLAAAGLTPAGRWLHPGGLPCWALLHALRVATAVPAELARGGRGAAAAGAPISEDRDAAPGGRMACGLQEGAAGFNTSLQPGHEAFNRWRAQ
ncbi:hypothetical protein WJX81_004943 [Elliptochloris bilobata]|uniref:SET domain-containing protein n=1 Tax=Elliptochloris bilobata TaxID=381761 RepID=A0AAW1SCT9_9CHLO